VKPVLVLQHLTADGPAYLGSWLRREGIAFDVRNTEAGDAFPVGLSHHGALAVLGGEMSANDPLPSLRDAEKLIREAFALGVPVIGHCLGGQLMARALGMRVVDSPAPEVGWQRIEVAPDPLGEAWFGAPGPRTVFQWHYETFEVPPGATRLAGSDACPNQAFGLGPHLAMQFHVEVDAEKVGRWSLDDDDRRYRGARARHRSVDSGDAMRAGIAEHLPAHQALADRIYRRWVSLAR